MPVRSTEPASSISGFVPRAGWFRARFPPEGVDDLQASEAVAILQIFGIEQRAIGQQRHLHRAGQLLSFAFSRAGRKQHGYLLSMREKFALSAWKAGGQCVQWTVCQGPSPAARGCARGERRGWLLFSGLPLEMGEDALDQRRIRDRVLLKHAWGRGLVGFY